MRRILAYILALMAAMSLSGCKSLSSVKPSGAPDNIVMPETTAAQTPAAPAASATPAPAEASGAPQKTPAWQLDGARDISVWATYWDTADIIDEIAPYAQRLGALCYFEAFFAPNGELIMPEALSELYAAVEQAYPDNLWDSYVTYVNDIRDDANGGKFTLKSPDILSPFFKDEAAMDAHAEQLISFAVDNGFDGIEIDYEAMRKKPSLWQPFCDFIAKLYSRANETGLLLRVVLEPNTPFGEYVFPKGPTYVIMCYNLHGGHNGEGPKADFDFLSELIEAGSSLPGKRIYALATGGYDWDDKGEAVQVTLSEAYALFSVSATDATVRDLNSDALNFHYNDSSGAAHSVWFADTRTLASWAEFIKEAGFIELAYWRLGGNYIE